MRLIYIFLFLSLSPNIIGQSREHKTRKTHPIISIGEFKMGDDVLKYDSISGIKHQNFGDSISVYKLESSKIMSGIEIRDIKLKFAHGKLVEIDIEFNRDLYNIYSYLNGCTYKKTERGYTEISFVTHSKYLLVAFVYEYTNCLKNQDRMILYALE